MSTLKTSNIQDTSGNNNSTPEEISNGRAKAWVNFDGTTGTQGQNDVTIRSSFNVSSITDQSTGLYTVNFTNAMPNSNYAYSLNSQTGTTAGATTTYNPTVDSLSTTNMEVASFSNSTYEDHAYYSVIVFGD